MKNLLKQLVIVCYSCSVVASCASIGEESGLERDINFAGSDCISIRTIRDYTTLDRSTLLMKGGGNRTYLVTLMSPAFDLRSSTQIGFVSRDDSLCPYGGDRLVLDRMSNFDVMIRGISRLTPGQEDELLIRYGKKEPQEQQDQAPPEVKGAEVEELGNIE